MSRSLNKNIIFSLFILAFLGIFISSPEKYMASTLQGLVVWANKVVPALFPFFVLTKLLTAIDTPFSVFDGFTQKLFNAPKYSGNIFCLSILSGYPVGAMLISDHYKKNAITQTQAQKMFSFCSTSGPIFIVGTVGIGMFRDANVGYILLICHIIGAILNGIIFRNKEVQTNEIRVQSADISLYDNMYNSILSILFVGGYIAVSFVLVDMLYALQIIPFIANAISHIFTFINPQVAEAVLSGIIEITRGCLELAGLNLSTKMQVILAGGIISFSGLCIFLQSLTFLNKIKIKKRTMLLYKFCQSLLTVGISIIVAYIFL